MTGDQRDARGAFGLKANSIGLRVAAVAPVACFPFFIGFAFDCLVFAFAGGVLVLLGVDPPAAAAAAFFALAAAFFAAFLAAFLLSFSSPPPSAAGASAGAGAGVSVILSMVECVDDYSNNKFFLLV